MLALIAGRGRLPELVAEAAAVDVICALEGQGPDRLSADVTFRLETFGSLLAGLQGRGVTEVCMAGAISRPSFDPSALDAATAPLVPVLAEALKAGDDGALRAVMGLFETAGIKVRAAHDLVPGLLMPSGILTHRAPNELLRADADKGAAILLALSPFDVGQACVIAAGQMLGCEGIGGTEHMLATLPVDRRGGVLVKGPKRGQDARADMPTIGPETVAQAAQAGLSGICLTAGGVIVLGRDEVIAACDAAGLALWGRNDA